jgi:hypothetical protein
VTGRLAKRRVLGSCAVLLGAGALAACAAPTTSRSADPTRATTPVPTCFRRLPARSPTGFARQMPEREYWDLVVPGLSAQHPPTEQTLACNGVAVFGADTFAGSSFQPAAIEEGRLTYGGGINRLRVLWLRSHEGPAPRQAGPLALVRIMEEGAEVYGVGAYRGHPEKSRFGIERLGGELVVVATDDQCASAGPSDDCDTLMILYLPSAGRLAPLAVLGVERTRFATGLEPGIVGALKFKLTSSPSFQPDGVHVVEQITVTDSIGKVLRRAELERLYVLQGSRLESAEPSLWDRMYEARLGSAQKADAASGGGSFVVEKAPTEVPEPAPSTGE